MLLLLLEMNLQLQYLLLHSSKYRLLVQDRLEAQVAIGLLYGEAYKLAGCRLANSSPRGMDICLNTTEQDRQLYQSQCIDTSPRAQANVSRIITPIKVSHSLVSEIYFSVWGEDDRGIELSIPGPGGLRFLRIEKPVILPSCSLIPARLDVPDCKYPPIFLDS